MILTQKKTETRVRRWKSMVKKRSMKMKTQKKTQKKKTKVKAQKSLRNQCRSRNRRYGSLSSSNGKLKQLIKLEWQRQKNNSDQCLTGLARAILTQCLPSWQILWQRA